MHADLQLNQWLLLQKAFYSGWTVSSSDKGLNDCNIIYTWKISKICCDTEEYLQVQVPLKGSSRRLCFTEHLSPKHSITLWVNFLHNFFLSAFFQMSSCNLSKRHSGYLDSTKSWNSCSCLRKLSLSCFVLTRICHSVLGHKDFLIIWNFEKANIFVQKFCKAPVMPNRWQMVPGSVWGASILCSSSPKLEKCV